MKEYEGLYKRLSAKIFVFPTCLKVVGQSTTFEISYSQLAVEIQGQNSSYIVIKDKFDKDKVVVLEDREILDAMNKFKTPLSESSKTILLKSTRRRTVTKFAVILIPLYLVFLPPLLIYILPAHTLGSLIPIEKLRPLGELILQDSDIIETPNKERDLIDFEIDQLFLKNPILSKNRIDIYYSRSSDVNAFALPGGIVVVNQGLIDQSESKYEVLAVIAHELAHVEKRHVLKSLFNSLGLTTGVVILEMIFKGSSSLSSLVGNFSQLSYSRNHEFEADSRGFELLRNAGVSPKFMISFFQKLKDLQGSAPVLQILSSHPATEQRIERLSQMLEKETAD